MVKTIDVRGIPHAYELTAPTHSDTVLVFVHGWLLSREYWQPLIQRLSPSYQCLSYDLRGFGNSQLGNCLQTPIQPTHRAVSSAKESSAVEHNGSRRASSLVSDPPESTLAAESVSNYTPAAYAHDLADLLQQLNIARAWLIGHSLGGSIALWAADQAPAAVSGVICVNSGGGIYLKEEFERFRAAGQQLVKFRPRWLCHVPLIHLPMTRMNVARPIAPHWGKQRLLDLVAAHPDAALGTLLDSTTETEVHRLPQVVSRLQQPVYFIAGADDDIMEPKYVRHLASFHPLFDCCGHNVAEIPNCGHLSMVEQPEAVAAEIQAILAKHQAD